MSDPDPPPIPASPPASPPPNHTLHAAGDAVRPSLEAWAASSPSTRAALRDLKLEFAPKGALTPPLAAALAATAARGNLESLRIDGCEGLEDTTVAQLLAGGGPKLRTLSLYWTPALRDSLYLIGGGDFSSLNRLNLSGCIDIEDSGLQAVASGCPSLTHLDITRAKKLTDGGVAAAVKQLPKLQELTAYAVESIGDATLGALATTCPHLTSLDICGARAVSDDAAAAWARATPGLVTLGAAWVPNVGDATARAIGAACPNLRSLCLHGSKLVTDAGLAAIAAGCPHLTALDVTAAVGVEQRLNKEALAALFPRVTVWRLQR